MNATPAIKRALGGRFIRGPRSNLMIRQPIWVGPGLRACGSAEVRDRAAQEIISEVERRLNSIRTTAGAACGRAVAPNGSLLRIAAGRCDRRPS
jgi:hypothetical protein